MSIPKRFQRLVDIAKKPERIILGLMSGTSMDGLDMALCKVSGHGQDTRVELLQSKTVDYTANDRSRLAMLVSQDEVSLPDLCIFNEWIAEYHASLVLAALMDWGVQPSAVDCLASHGQTIYHAPTSWNHEGAMRHATLQMGDGDHLAVRTGILTLSDFRQKEVAGGGEGAPLAPYAEGLLFSDKNPRILLNLGGIANMTWLPPKGAGVFPIFGDTGPANALIDRAVRMTLPDNAEGYDYNGRIAKKGKINRELLETLKDEPYFAKPCPKSTGPELFGDAFVEEAWKQAQQAGDAPEDFIATLTRLTVETIAETILNEIPTLANTELFGSGGGWKNPTIRRWMRELLPDPAFHEASELGFPSDVKEAMLFAVLANESLAGDGFQVLMKGGDGRSTAFGKFSFPD